MLRRSIVAVDVGVFIQLTDINEGTIAGHKSS